MQSYLRSGIIGGALLISGVSWAGPVVECRVPFKFDSSVVSRSAVDSCVKILELTAKNSKEELEIVASATPEGTAAYNDALSQRRASSLQTALLERVPGLKTRTRAMGEIPHDGLIARIVTEVQDQAVALNQEARDVQRETVRREDLTASIGISDAMTKTAAEPSGRWRVGPRLGRDHTRVEDKIDYLSPGIDVAYVPLTNTPNLRVEVGAIGNVYLEGDSQRMNSIHFAPMVGYQSLTGMIAGVRGLVGIVNSDVSNDRLDDAGLELRLGRETRNWSAFLGVGQTNVMDRIGLDLGYRF